MSDWLPPDPVPNTRRAERRQARALTREALNETTAQRIVANGCALGIAIVFLAVCIAVALFILSVGRGL